MLIGLMGKKKSGKDTIADYLVEKHNFYKLGFADKLKKTVADLWDLSTWQVYTQEGKEALDIRYGLTSRDLQKKLGDAVREIYGKTWIYHTFKHIQHIKQVSGGTINNFVIKDVRSINEFEAIKDNKGICIKVIREDLESNDTHRSETEMDNIPLDAFYGVISAKTGEINKLHFGIDQIVLKYLNQ